MTLQTLPNDLADKLINLPETGMGHHLIYFILDDGSKVPASVLNCRFTEFQDIARIVDVELRTKP